MSSFTDSEYERLAGLAPAGKLELVLDQENDGADIHLGKIADAMVNWDTELAPALGLTSNQVSDIKEMENAQQLKGENNNLLLCCHCHIIFYGYANAIELCLAPVGGQCCSGGRGREAFMPRMAIC